MPAVVANTATFFEALKKSNLLSSKQVAHLRAMATQAGVEADPRAIAEALVQKRLITRWHASQLLAGRFAFFLGKYKLLERIGSGGMGSVFKCENTKVGNIVALKVISKQRLAQPGAVARFNREIQAAAALHHPNIIEAYDADKVGDTHFLVMEYVEGRDLNGWLKQYEQLPIDWSCECIRQAALGLQHAHEMGMVHRDVKPGNLLVSQDPDTGVLQVKLLDMGLARFTAEAKSKDGDITQTGQILGTPDYIAPEQARDTKNADIRADVFSLGCTLFRILTGQLPFEGDNPVEKLVARYTQDAPPLLSLRPDAPPQLGAVVAKMLARDPKQRYQTPVEVAEALTPFAIEQVVDEAMGSTGGSMLRMDVTAAMLADAEPTTGGSPQVDAGSATGEFLNLLAGVQRTIETNTPHVSGDTTDSLGSRIPGGRSRQTRVKRYPNRPGVVGWLEERYLDLPTWGKVGVAGLAAALVLMLGMTGRSWWIQLSRGIIVVEWADSERAESSIVVDGETRSVPKQGPIEIESPPGAHKLVLRRIGYKPFEVDLELGRGGRETIKPQWIPTPENALAIQREADKKKREEEFRTLAAEARKLRAGPANPQQLSTMRLALEKFSRTWTGTAEALEANRLMASFPVPLDQLSPATLPAEFQPFAQQAPLTAVFGAPGTDEFRHNTPVICLAYNQDRSRLATATQEGMLLWDVQSKKVLHRLVEARRAVAMAFSPDGKTLATMGYGASPQNPRVFESAIDLWDVASGMRTATIKAPSMAEMYYRLAWQPGTNLLVTARGAAGEVQLWDAAGKLVRTQPIHMSRITQFYFSADGKRMVSASQPRPVPGQPIVVDPILLWDTSGATWTSKPLAERSSMGGFALSPDGQQLAVLDIQRRELRITNLAKADPPRSIPMDDFFATSIEFSPDGKLVAFSNMRVNLIRVVDVATGRTLGELADARGLGNSFMFVTPTEIAFARHSTYKIDVANWASDAPGNRAGHIGAVTSISFNPAGDRLASVGIDGRLIVWNAARGAPVPLPPAVAALTGVYSALYSPYSPAGSTLAVATLARKLYLLDAQTLAIKSQHDGILVMPELQNHPPVAWAFTADGKYLLAGWNDRTLRVLDATTGAVARNLPASVQPIAAVATSPNGKLLALARSNISSIDLWDTSAASPEQWSATGSLVAGHQVLALGFDPESVRLVSGGDRAVRMWDPKTRDIKGGAEQGALTLGFSLDKKTMATCDGAGLLQLWDYRLLAPEVAYQMPEYLQVVNGTPASVRSVHQLQISPEGRHVATANGNGTIYILRLGSAPTGAPPPPQ